MALSAINARPYLLITSAKVVHMKSAIKYSAEVSAAIAASMPIVALESTIISHGLPRPSNLAVAIECERIIRDRGSIPATIALLDGVIHIGLEAHELEAIANRDDISKASIRDLAIIVAQGKSAATTVAATAHIAAMSGIRVFAQCTAPMPRPIRPSVMPRPSHRVLLRTVVRSSVSGKAK